MSHLVGRPNRQGDSSSLRGEIRFLQNFLRLAVTSSVDSMCLPLPLSQTQHGSTDIQASRR